MSDPIAEAAESMNAAPVSADPAPPATGAVMTDAPVVTGNVLVNSAPTVDAPVIDAPAVEEAPAELPRESHLMLLEHKLAAMHAKFKTGERILIDEFEQILGHIRAVL